MSTSRKAIKIFVSYSRHDAKYLENDSLLGFLKGLEGDQVEFWTDRDIRAGESWDEVIKAQNEGSPQQATGYQREMHDDETPRFLKLFPL